MLIINIIKNFLEKRRTLKKVKSYRIRWIKEKEEIFSKAPSSTYIYKGTEFKIYSNDPFIKKKWDQCEELERIREKYE